MSKTAGAARSWSWCLLLASMMLPSVNTLHGQVTDAGRALGVSEVSQHLGEMNRRRAAALVRYESNRLMTVTFEGPLAQGEATETVLMSFTAPSTKQFTVLSSTGSKWIRDNVFQRALDAESAASSESAQRGSTLNAENYMLKLVGVEQLPAGRCYVLDVTPKVAGEFTYVGRVWIQANDFALVRIQGKPSLNPSPWISEGEFTTSFQKVGDFYFPQQTVSSSQLPSGLRARLTIQYGPYHILSALGLERLGSR